MIGGDTAYHLADYMTLAMRIQQPFEWAFEDLKKNLETACRSTSRAAPSSASPADALAWGVQDAPIEYCVQMRRFPARGAARPGARARRAHGRSEALARRWRSFTLGPSAPRPTRPMGTFEGGQYALETFTHTSERVPRRSTPGPSWHPCALGPRPSSNGIVTSSRRCHGNLHLTKFPSTRISLASGVLSTMSGDSEKLKSMAWPAGAGPRPRREPFRRRNTHCSCEENLMLAIHRILCPVDFSEPSERALE
jgi:hypothetical protein